MSNDYIKTAQDAKKTPLERLVAYTVVLIQNQKFKTPEARETCSEAHSYLRKYCIDMGSKYRPLAMVLEKVSQHKFENEFGSDNYEPYLVIKAVIQDKEFLREIVGRSSNTYQKKDDIENEWKGYIADAVKRLDNNSFNKSSFYKTHTSEEIELAQIPPDPLVEKMRHRRA